jgi:hypothetical protein
LGTAHGGRPLRPWPRAGLRPCAKRIEAESDPDVRAKRLFSQALWIGELGKKGELRVTLEEVKKKLVPAATKDGVLQPATAESPMVAALCKGAGIEHPDEGAAATRAPTSPPAQVISTPATVDEAGRLLAVLDHPLVKAKLQAIAFDAVSATLLASGKKP